MTLSQPSSQLFRTSDGATFPVTFHGADSTGPLPVVLLLPAMGVGASYYSLFAKQLAEGGFTVALTELRGQGASSPAAGRQTKHGFAEIVEVDIPQIVSMLRQRFQNRSVVFVGHSLGGQLGLLAHAHHGNLFDALVLVASGSAWYRRQTSWRGPRHLVAGHVFASISRVLGFWPGDHLGFGGRQPAQMMIDCARQASSGSYRLPTASSDYEAELAVISAKVLFVEIDGDILTPPAAVDHLRSKLANAHISSLRLPRPDGSNLGAHFAWVRSSPEVATEIRAWFRSISHCNGRDKPCVTALENDLDPGHV